MISLRPKTLTAIIIAITTSALAPCASAQDPQTPPPRPQPPVYAERPMQPAQGPQPQATPAPRGPEFVEEKGFKGKIFDIKYRDPAALTRAVQPLGSGFKGATMQYNQELRTISVRDFPENIATIEEALKRLDTPEAARPDIEFTIHVLIASNAPGATDYPAELSDVIKPLQSALRYKSYGLMTSAIHRAKEGRDGVTNTGVAESKLFSIPQPQGSPTFYSYDLDNIGLDNSSGGTTVNIGKLSFNMRIPLSTGTSISYQSVGFRSPVSLHQGEKVVVGSTTMGDKGLIVVISARVLK